MVDEASLTDPPPLMTDIHAVCSYDATELVETKIVRLLEAEQHRVRLSVGRQSGAEIDAIRKTKCAVLLVWSPRACSQSYMLDWVKGVEPSRLVEIATAPGWPRIDREAPVIDFSKWRGERGSRAWDALKDRLRTVSRQFEPPKPPPKRAAFALGMASLAAMFGAIFVRVNDTGVSQAPIAAPPSADEFADAQPDPSIGMGGVLEAPEPASLDDLPELRRLPVQRFAPIEYQPVQLISQPTPELLDIRDPTLMERLQSINPLRRGDDDQR